MVDFKTFFNPSELYSASGCGKSFPGNIETSRVNSWGFFSFKREVKYMQISFSNLAPHASLYALRHLNLQPFFHGCASATERLTQQKKNNNNNIQLLSAGFDYVSNKQNISYYGGGGGLPLPNFDLKII